MSGTPVYVSLYWFTSVGMDVELDKKGIFLRIGKIQILSHGAILVASSSVLKQLLLMNQNTTIKAIFSCKATLELAMLVR